MAKRNKPKHAATTSANPATSRQVQRRQFTSRFLAASSSPPYTARAPHAMVGHDRLASRQAQPPLALPRGPGAPAGGVARVVRARGLRRGRDADPAGGTRGGGAFAGLHHRLADAG